MRSQLIEINKSNPPNLAVALIFYQSMPTSASFSGYISTYISNNIFVLFNSISRAYVTTLLPSLTT